MKKLIAESLFEYMGFTEEGDPVKDMGIGSKEAIKLWLKSQNISVSEYRLTRNLYIVVDNTVNLANRMIKQFPEYINFVVIHGGFHINNNELITLKGCPEKVSGSFFCSHNNLTSLEHCPIEVFGDFGASSNQLQNLEHFPTVTQGSIYLSKNNLTSCKGLPQRIQGSLFIDNNPLESLEFFPKIIEGELHITKTKNITKANIHDICSVSDIIFN